MPPESGDAPTDAPRGDQPPGMPRWVKMSLVVAAVLLLLVLILMITGIGGEHGPGRHRTGATDPAVNLATAAR